MANKGTKVANKGTKVANKGTKVFGQEISSRLFIPKGAADWKITDVVKKGDFDNILLLSFSISDQEIIDIKRCFQEVTHIFAYGRNTMACVLEMSFLVFLNDGCFNSKYKWMTVKDINDRYEKARIYKKQKSIQITIDDLSINGFLVRLVIGDVNPSTKSCVVSFSFLMDQEV